MKTLKEHILEGILDIEDNINIDTSNMTKDVIEEFLKENYSIKGSYNINETKNIFIVDVTGYVDVTNKNITSLTNGLFEFSKIVGSFNCSGCESLKTLKGSPKEVGWSFNCSYCKSLKTLEGAPKKVGETFYCNNCKSLKSLKGAPQECYSFYCNNCESLKTLEGAPEKVKGEFYCNYCGIEFTENDVRKYTKVDGDIRV